MKKLMIVALTLVFALCVTGNALAGEKEDCIKLCKDAAKMIKDKGLDAAKAEVNKKDGKFVKGSVYVFMTDMTATMIAHPLRPDLIGKNLKDLKDSDGTPFFQNFVNVAKGKDGKGWVGYKWPKKKGEDPSQKESYILKAGDAIVGAGYYK
ncbi:cache domain-containing protein [Desulfobacterales bacterium HSG2]|nr:cache domain-containing protein [Desulfobacterales bacterium HSG2]